jgi:hypothetical protein
MRRYRFVAKVTAHDDGSLGGKQRRQNRARRAQLTAGREAGLPIEWYSMPKLPISAGS